MSSENPSRILQNWQFYSIKKITPPKVSGKLPLEDFKTPDVNIFAFKKPVQEHKHQMFMILEDPRICLEFWVRVGRLASS